MDTAPSLEDIYREYREIVRDKQPVEFVPGATSFQNTPKNRYGDVLPINKTAVKLKRIQGVEDSDYINANYVYDDIDGEFKIRQIYICCQAPLVTTFNDFWRMIWEQNVPIIVMITNLVEKNRVKADPYWPMKPGHVERFGDVLVKFVKEQVQSKSITVRSFRIWQRPSNSSSESKSHEPAYDNDSRTPSDDAPSIDFSNSDDSLDDGANVSTKEFVPQTKKPNFLASTTTKQTVLTTATTSTTTTTISSSPPFSTKSSLLTKNGSYTPTSEKRSSISPRVSSLTSVPSNHSSSSSAVTKTPSSEFSKFETHDGSNRIRTDSNPTKHSPRGSSHDKHAQLHSSLMRNSLLSVHPNLTYEKNYMREVDSDSMTEGGTEATSTSLEMKEPSIIMKEIIKEKPKEQDDDVDGSGSYDPPTPDDSIEIAADSFSCEHDSTATSEEDECKDEEEFGEVRDVVQLHCTNWPDFGIPDSSQEMVNLINELDIRKKSLEQPVVVHCSAGIGRTGTFVAIHMCLNRSLHGLDYDIKKVVKHLRTQRLGMVQSKEQYSFVYTVTRDMIQNKKKIPIAYSTSKEDHALSDPGKYQPPRKSSVHDAIIRSMTPHASSSEDTVPNKKEKISPGRFRRSDFV